MAEKTMTKEQMAKMIEDLTAQNDFLKKSHGQTVKNKIVELIESGVNCIEDIATTCSITSKNVSSNLTAIRADLKERGETIVTQRVNKRTMLAVVKFNDLGW